MEISTICDCLAHERVNSVSESVVASESAKQSLCRVFKSVVTEHGNALIESLQIEHAQELMSGCSLGLNNNQVFGPQENEEPPNLNQIESSTAGSEKVFVKSATFPSSMGDDTESNRPTCSRSVSLPSRMKLVSAMKGGRERQEGLTVTWGPDVYDPPATSLSHTVNGYSQQQRSRNSKKKKRKGKASSREKKQYPRKHTAEPQRSSMKSNNNNDVFCEETSSEDYLDFSVKEGPQESSNCGTSFLRSSAVDKVHIPFAEAT
ncbi:hypothetical protein ACHQM5_009771 [Ranunculus cassubicifolius]